MMHGFFTIPKSITPIRIAESVSVFGRMTAARLRILPGTIKLVIDGDVQ
ncbi:MAG: hypothetical protein R3E75_10700 [Steroidobacteraceae bacterium]|nr:hypothetical protein [Nevskiaceae bacterium]